MRMLSHDRLVSVVSRIGRDLQGREYGGFSTHVSPRGDAIHIQWRGETVLVVDQFQERKRFNRPEAWETTYTASFNTYLGWKLYMLLTGCLASGSKENEAQLEEGINCAL